MAMAGSRSRKTRSRVTTAPGTGAGRSAVVAAPNVLQSALLLHELDSAKIASVGAQIMPDEIDAVVAALNHDYYKFK